MIIRQSVWRRFPFQWVEFILASELTERTLIYSAKTLRWTLGIWRSFLVNSRCLAVVNCKLSVSRGRLLWILGISLSAWLFMQLLIMNSPYHDDVIKWKQFPRYLTFVRGIHLSPVNSPHKGQWCGALMVSLICVWINGWVNNREAGYLRRHRTHYDVIVMYGNRFSFLTPKNSQQIPTA